MFCNYFELFFNQFDFLRRRWSLLMSSLPGFLVSLSFKEYESPALSSSSESPASAVSRSMTEPKIALHIHTHWITLRKVAAMRRPTKRYQSDCGRNWSLLAALTPDPTTRFTKQLRKLGCLLLLPDLASSGLRSFCAQLPALTSWKNFGTLCKKNLLALQLLHHSGLQEKEKYFAIKQSEGPDLNYPVERKSGVTGLDKGLDKASVHDKDELSVWSRIS